MGGGAGALGLTMRVLYPDYQARVRQDDGGDCDRTLAVQTYGLRRLTQQQNHRATHTTPEQSTHKLGGRHQHHDHVAYKKDKPSDVCMLWQWGEPT